jgi:inhibitor of KinA
VKNATPFRVASDRSLLIYLGDVVSPDAHARVRKLLNLLQREPLTGIRNLHPAYCSVMITFDPLKLTHGELQQMLVPYLDELDDFPPPEPRRVEVPVCYAPEFGTDLGDVAAFHGLTPDQVIALHSAAHYIVYFLGFVPGFAYMGGLPEQLATPRLGSPRREVPRGSVGIAGNQTGIYPLPTPGGWRLIGRTPVKPFEPEREQMNLLEIGDRVRFVPISQKQFEEMQKP